ncbi:hypothetical protein B1H10_07880 [candidate division KSB1 bacterium 4484_188]|nr:MAG: hypothetical protein B1H10_07880 [candidate division KSB1 bacterium 4484_188]
MGSRRLVDLIFYRDWLQKKIRNRCPPLGMVRPFTSFPQSEAFKLQADCYEAFFRTFWDKE